MTLRSKINILVLLNIVLVLSLVMSVISYMFIQNQFQETGQRALTLSKTVASLPEIIEAFHETDPSTTIQPITKDIQHETGAQFIVVANMKQIRFSHPNPLLIGKAMDPDPGDDQKVLNGQESITEAKGSLGYSVRGKAPVFDSQHQQIGIVSVGFLVSDIWNRILGFLLRTTLLGLVGLAIGLWGAYLLSGHVKRQIFNMEPFEIALLSQEQACILESIREGILAVDDQGKITACNYEAKRIIGLSDEDEVVGKFVHTILPNSRLPEVLEEGVPHTDQPMIIGNTLIIANRVPVTLNGRVIGAVASFRDKIELEQIDQRLADVGRYADALRSQRHEFMNKLHTISGLIQMGEYHLVRQVVDQVNDEQQQLLQFFMTRIHDPAVVGTLIGKVHRARERGITLNVDSNSQIAGPCPHREVVVTVLGNAIENAIEAMTGQNFSARQRVITVYLNDQADELILHVKDSGPGIDPELKARIFEDGVTTKGPGRGFGFTLVSRLVSNVGGRLSILSSDEGATVEVMLPKNSSQ
jgi:two-component system CitB family sensor kinase